MGADDGPAKTPFQSDRVEKSALNLYIQTLAGSVLGYVYWIVATRLLSPEAIGLMSAALGVSIMLVNLAALGVPLGIQRLLGKFLAENDTRSFYQYFRSAFTLISLGIAVIFAALVAVWLVSGSTFLPDELILLTIVLLPQAFPNILRSAFIAMQRTKPLLLVNLVAHTGKLVLGTILMLAGLGVSGLLAGHLAFYIGSAVGLGAILLRIMPAGIKAIPVRETVRPIISSGMPSWLPGTVAAVGSQLGVVAVFGLQGAGEAGLYFIAFSIMNFLLAIPQSLIGALFPALSGRIQDTQQATSRVLIMSCIILLPAVSFITIFAQDVLGMFGEQYKGASFVLALLVLSTVPYTIHAAVDTYFYARGDYGKAIIMGVISEAPKVLLYILLVPLFSGEGAAYSYLIGVVFGMVASIVVAAKTRTKIKWRILATLLLVTGGVSYLVYLSGIPWYAGLVVLFVPLPILYARCRIITRSEASDLVDAFPALRSKLKSENMKWLAKLLFG